MDTLSKEKRSQLMSNIRGKNTSIELQMRSILFNLGYRYRVHYKKLPGKPDLAFPGRRKVIFIHGCFWHMHPKCKGARFPKSNAQYWKAKLELNKKRDENNLLKIRRLDWKCLVIWECEMKNMKKALKKVVRFLKEK